jgi:putative acetyltransferase
MEVKLRKGAQADFARVKMLYKSVATNEGGIARVSREITDEYINEWMEKSMQRGLWIVAEDQDGQLMGSIHAYRPGPQVFNHLFSELTIAVDPRAQGQGVGRKLFSYFQEYLKNSSSGVHRVELFVRESNGRAQTFYESIGFKAEGRFENRIQSLGGGYEADIPMAWTF